MKRIRLSSGRYTFVDDEDVGLLRQFRWHEYKVQKNRTSYAMMDATTWDGRHTTIRMHRFVVGAKDGQLVDHKDGNGLNNQKSNLRIISSGQNKRNAPKYRTHAGKKPASRFKGVSRDSSSSKRKPWRARIRVDGELRCLGHFRTQKEAAEAYNRAAEEVQP